MKTTLELVHDLQALLSGPEKWTQGVMAKDANGITRTARSDEACCWCFYGAMKRLVVEWSWEFTHLRGAAERAGITGSLSDWNDAPERTFADIVSLMARMEALAREEAA